MIALCTCSAPSCVERRALVALLREAREEIKIMTLAFGTNVDTEELLERIGKMLDGGEEK